MIVRPDKTVASLGYNGFPRGVEDRPEWLADREIKLELTVHAELNAILHAREPLHGFTLYTWPFMPCSRCAAAVAQAGITRAVAPLEMPERWRVSFELAQEIFHQANVAVDLIRERRGETS